MSRRPVFVIHGVANSDEQEFNARVVTLAGNIERAYGDRWDFVPVFWDRLGADVRGVQAAIPPLEDGALVRSGPDGVLLDGSMLWPGMSLINAAAGTSVVRAGVDARESVIAAAQARAGSGAPAGVRGGTDPNQLRDAIDAAWGNLRYLPEVRDEAVLAAVGRLVADAVGVPAEPSMTRNVFDDIRAAVGAILHQTDVLAGILIGRVGEVAHFVARSALVPKFGKGAGDVLVYQAHRAEIGQVVRDRLAAFGPRLGTADEPALAIGHSLGGIIAFDLAVTDDRPVHWQHLVTFGSQSPLLHVIDPRRGALGRYDPDDTADPPRRVRLPSTIAAWTNIWEPWDPLAFYASRVFELGDGGPVIDIRLPHLGSTPLWTHSMYWTQEEAWRTIGEALAAATPPG